MDQPVEIILSHPAEPTPQRNLQLYAMPAYSLPQFGDFDLEPFVQLIREESEVEPPFTPPISYSFTHNPQYQRVIGSTECYPLGLTLSNKHIIIASKNEILVFDLFEFDNCIRFQTAGVVTAMDALADNLAVGYKSGKIQWYSLTKKALMTEISYYSRDIMRLKWVRFGRLCAIDTIGSMVFFDLSVKTIMDKIIGVKVDDTPLYEDNKEKKRDKIKKIWKSFVSKEESEVTERDYLSQFTLIYDLYEAFIGSATMVCAVFRKGTVRIALVDKQNLALKNQQNLFQGKHIEEVGVFTFGVGGFDVANQSFLLFVASVANTLNFFKFVKVDDNIEWHHVYTLDIAYPLYGGNFISNNLIVVLSQKGVELATVGDQPELMAPIDFGKFGYVDYFNSEENLNIDKNILFRNILRSRWIENMFCCIEGKRLIIGTIESWQSYLNILTNQSKWQEAMRCALMIYQGRLKKLAGINENLEKRKEEMMTFFEKITITYLTFQLKQQENKQQTLKRAINFMLDTENYNHLFGTVYEAICSLGYKDLFFQVIEMMIRRHKVKQVPSDALVECIKVYQAQNKQALIETLIMNLDLEQVQRLVLLQTCLKFKMLRSLIHVCVSQEDFVTPIIKICSLAVQTADTERIRDILFWYIKGCLRGQFIESYNDQKYLMMLEKIVTYIFIPFTLKMLCKLDPFRFFILINKFFESRILQLMLQNSERFTIRKNKDAEQPLFQSSSSQFQVYEQMLQNVINTEYEDNSRAQAAKQRFVVYMVLKNQFRFNQEVKCRAIRYFISDPYTFGSDTTEHDMNAYLMRLFDSCLTKARLTQLCQSFIACIHREDKAEILAQSLCYLYHQLRKFSRCFEIYLKMRNYEIRQKLLMYLENNIDIPELKQEILNNIVSLVKIQEDRALKLFASKMPNDCQEIINKLAAFPKYQLKYLELLFQNKHFLADELKIIHLSIVLKYDRQEVESFLQKMDYPLDEAYKVCQEAGHKPAMAYLSCKKGMTLEGAMILADLFCQVSDEVVKAVARKQQVNLTQLHYRLQQLLLVCHDEYQVDQMNGEVVWFRCLQKVFKHIKIDNLVKDNVPVAIRQLLNDIVMTILNKICSQVTVQFFVETFTKHFSTLPLNVFSKAYLMMKERLRYTERTYTLTRTLMQMSHLEEHIEMHTLHNHGNVSDGSCNKCKQTLYGMSVLFPCHHSYHFDCAGEYKCPECSSKSLSLNQSHKVLSCKLEGVEAVKATSQRCRLELFDDQLANIKRSYE